MKYIEPLSIKVTAMKGMWVCSLFNIGKLQDQMTASMKCDIGYCCREMLRWFSKCGGYSKMAEASRARVNKNFKNYPRPVGNIKYHSNY